MISRFILLLFLLSGAMSCSNTENNNIAPTISFEGVNKERLIQGSLGLEDTLQLSISFFDPDGDISGLANNIVVTDLRNSQVHYTNTFPALPDNQAGDQGTFTLFVPTVCCLYDDGTPPCESRDDDSTNTLVFEVYVIDAAENKSNVITTPELSLLCN